MKNYIYPPTPQNVSVSVLKPSGKYKSEVFKVTAAIIFFMITYIFLIAVACAFAFLLSFGGIKLISLHPSFITIMLGLGMIACGVMVVFFLLKFLFSIKRIDKSGFYEIKKGQYPELFDFIKKLTKETKNPMPKKVYLSADVNASVFYNSSFLSMFIPVRKNLLIGMGLVNSINMSEFKAVLAHEFGHFSQHSMSLGSYVYHVNKIIYNMLYENKGYANVVDNWAAISDYFALFAKLNIKIIQGIQWVLQKVYVIVNIAELSLSRQMEFHADTVSAFVCGSNHQASSLYRLEISSECYNHLLNFYNELISENYKPDNLFLHHREVLKAYCKDNKLECLEGLPLIDTNFYNLIPQSRINVKNQWASHPSTKERSDYIKSLHIPETKIITESPLQLFGDYLKLQELLTEKLFSTVEYKNTPVLLDLDNFKEKFENSINKFKFNNQYNGYYNNRRISHFDLINPPLQQNHQIKSQLEFYTDNNCKIVSKINQLESDLDILRQISIAGSGIKSFDFDGTKYPIISASEIIEKLEKELQTEKENLIEIDQSVYWYLYYRSNEQDKEELKLLYETYFNTISEVDKGIKNYNELVETINPIYQVEMPPHESMKIIKKVKEIEKHIITQFNQLLDKIEKDGYVDKSILEKIKEYVSKDRDYFMYNHGYLNSELNFLHESLNTFINVLYIHEFRIKKQLLDKQITIDK